MTAARPSLDRSARAPESDSRDSRGPDDADMGVQPVADQRDAQVGPVRLHRRAGLDLSLQLTDREGAVAQTRWTSACPHRALHRHHLHHRRRHLRPQHHHRGTDPQRDHRGSRGRLRARSGQGPRRRVGRGRRHGRRATGSWRRRASSFLRARGRQPGEPRLAPRTQATAAPRGTSMPWTATARASRHSSSWRSSTACRSLERRVAEGARVEP